VFQPRPGESLGYLHDEFVVDLILEAFTNLDSLTLVDKRHSPLDDRNACTVDLAFMDPVRLLIWQEYDRLQETTNTAELDMLEIRALILKAFENTVPRTWTDDDIQRFRKHCIEEGLPKIGRKIITYCHAKGSGTYRQWLR